MTRVEEKTARALRTPAAQDILIVGASGDLTRRKLLPALYNLYVAGLLPPRGRIIGLARTEMLTENFRDMAHGSIKQFSRSGLDESRWPAFEQRLSYLRLDDGIYKTIAGEMDTPDRLIYLAVPPDAVEGILMRIYNSKLANHTRLVMEKPFGEDLATAQQLNRDVHRYFEERQVFRIDHYLGKETVQNILVFRFGNSVFERVWNRDAIERIEITVAEALGMEGRGKS
ncbi:MAG TPA: glucose-6-phosphate dehydrogenase, partial [Dehalococcoidia bacterium]